ncbi:hypothetical protein J6590_049895 [Homalodisca vitripennis]|nr:hypothetical protein J6590_049895 [Homalodisca vitripennis]
MGETCDNSDEGEWRTATFGKTQSPQRAFSIEDTTFSLQEQHEALKVGRVVDQFGDYDLAMAPARRGVAL